jgi:hypothetical protein
MTRQESDICVVPEGWWVMAYLVQADNAQGICVILSSAKDVRQLQLLCCLTVLRQDLVALCRYKASSHPGSSFAHLAKLLTARRAPDS